MSFVQALSPLPAILRNRAKPEKLRSSISRTWICLALNNAVVMGSYAWKRGDLSDSLLGNFIGKHIICETSHLFLTFIGFGTNFLTLFIYDWTLSNTLSLFLTLSYHALLCYILNNFASLGTLTYLGTAASILSVNLVPLTLLLKQLRSVWLSQKEL